MFKFDSTDQIRTCSRDTEYGYTDFYVKQFANVSEIHRESWDLIYMHTFNLRECITT